MTEIARVKFKANDDGSLVHHPFKIRTRRSGPNPAIARNASNRLAINLNASVPTKFLRKERIRFLLPPRRIETGTTPVIKSASVPHGYRHLWQTRSWLRRQTRGAL